MAVSKLWILSAAKGYCSRQRVSIKQNLSHEVKSSRRIYTVRFRGRTDDEKDDNYGVENRAMDANNLIACNAVNRLDDISIRGSGFPTRHKTRNFGSFCPRLTCERRLLSQGVDFFTPHFVSMGRFASIGGRIVWQTTSFGTVRDCNKSVTSQGWHLIRMNRRGWYRGEGARETVGLYRQNPLTCLA